MNPKPCNDLNEAAVHGVYEAVLHELLRQQQRRVRGPRDEAVQLTVHVVLHGSGVSTFHTSRKYYFYKIAESTTILSDARKL